VQVCVVGSGGREHALAQVLGRDAEVVVTPGNAGIPGSVAAPPEEIEADLFVIGPEGPLVEGLADRLRALGRLVFGPGIDGARLEGSKVWMKEILVQAGVPTARYGAFSDEDLALSFLGTMHDLFVVKTDGLAGGKGVLVTEERAEAVDAVRSYLSGKAFGDAGRTVVIEEGLTGPELSLLVISDGSTAVPLTPAQDFKRINDEDRGPNTGGMGAYSPVPLANDLVVDSLMDEIVDPTLNILRGSGIDYRGVLYCGLMFTPSGPKVLEYNIRFGDPEAQVVLPRISSSLTELLASAASGLIGDLPVFNKRAAVTVVCAAEGYPVSPRTGDPIQGLDEASALTNVTVFCSGVADSGGRLVTAGGRVLSVTGMGTTISAARDRAYTGANLISWPGIHRRTDIGASPVSVVFPD